MKNAPGRRYEVYFIREWQELRDQVRLTIINDPRYAISRQLSLSALRVARFRGLSPAPDNLHYR